MKIRMWSAMFIAGVITASITSSFALTTRAAAAANNQTYCENRADDVTDSIKQNLTDLESNDPMLVRWDWIGKESMMYRPYAAKCPPEPAKDAILGFSTIEHAAALWHAGKPWQDETNLARQMLDRCRKAASATALGARCESGEQRANQLFVYWNTHNPGGG